MVERIESLLTSWGLNDPLNAVVSWTAVVVFIVLLSIVANAVTKRILLASISRLIRRSIRV